MLSFILFSYLFFFFNDTATTEIYTTRHTLSLHDALPISNLLPTASLDVSGAEGALNGMARGYSVSNFEMLSLLPGQLGGIVVDPTGAMVPNAQVTVTQIDTGAQRTVVTDNSGRWIVSNLSTGRVK